MITTILFDLDGTLLPMDQDVFVGTYMKGLAAVAAPYGYEPTKFIGAVMAGTAAMVKNGGDRPNETAFWSALEKIYGDQIKSHMHIFDSFYLTDFQKIRHVCGFSAKSAAILSRVKELGFRTALATNPLFPSVATESRIEWAGLKKDDFEWITTFENSSYAKPNPDYYREVCRALGAEPNECLMVGNDVSEDMVARDLGMKVFLLTDCLINKKDEDISAYPHGGFDELMRYVENLNKNDME